MSTSTPIAAPTEDARDCYFRNYNYDRFSFASEPEERRFFSDHAPALGSTAPDFELETVEGRAFRLSATPKVPIVIEFGSYTCPLFLSRVEAMDDLAHRFDDVLFTIVYVREAHPGEVTPQPTTIRQKRENAIKLIEQDSISRALLIDDIEGNTHLRYGGGYNSVFVLDQSKRVVLRRFWNEPSDVRRVLVDLRSGLRPVPFGSLRFGSPSLTPQPGPLILERGGREALLDFAQDAPRSIGTALETSTEAVRMVLCQAEGDQARL